MYHSYCSISGRAAGVRSSCSSPPSVFAWLIQCCGLQPSSSTCGSEGVGPAESGRGGIIEARVSEEEPVMKPHP